MLFKIRKNISGNKSISVIRLQLSVAQLNHTKDGKRKEPWHLDVGNINYDEEERRPLCLLPPRPEPG